MTAQKQAPHITLAETFARLLREYILPSQFELMRLANKAEANPEVCHSHDFLDANEVMAEAFRLTLGREIDLQSDADVRLWAEAWSAAKANELTA